MKQHGNVHSKAGRKNGKLGGRPIGRKDTKPRKKESSHPMKYITYNDDETEYVEFATKGDQGGLKGCSN